MDTFLLVDREERNKARIATAILTVLFFILLLLPWFTYQNPPPGQEGTIVNLGTLAIGQGEENAPESNSTPLEAEKEEQEEPASSVKEEVKETKKEKPQEKPQEKPEPKKEPESKKVIKDNSENIALAEAKKKKKKEQEEKAKKEKKAAEKAEKLAEAERQKKAAEEKRIAKEKRIAAEKAAAAKAAEDAKLAEANDLKNNLKDLFGKSGEGEGKGETGTPGNQGVKGGDPKASAVEGISSGSGVVSGGLTGRGGSGPGIKDNSNKSGTIMIKVCVDSQGKVSSASYTQKGSTLLDPSLKKKAVENAYKWNFKSGSADKQCGFIKYEFKVE